MLVTHLGRLFVHIERIGVLHRELAATEQPSARPRFVSELGLDLIQVLGQIPVALHLAARQIGDDLLVRRSEVVIRVLAILQSK